jgi:hypothetical protein
MLQINTGKHFRGDLVRINWLRGVLIGNVRTQGKEKIETEADPSLAADGASQHRAFVYKAEEWLKRLIRSGAIASHT